MWKYIGVKECNEFLLSLQLFKYNNQKKYIKTLYSISNNIGVLMREKKLKDYVSKCRKNLKNW